MSVSLLRRMLLERREREHWFTSGCYKTSRVHSVHVTKHGGSIRWHRDRTVTVLLPLKGHKTSYDTDRNSPPLVITAERERRGGRHSKTQSRALKGLREAIESHMIVCVTDHCNLASANKCTFVKKQETPAERLLRIL